jgi:hypothetical protein
VADPGGRGGRIVAEPFGLQAYGRADWLARLLREQPRVTSALLRIAPGRAGDVRARLKELPAVAGATSRRARPAAPPCARAIPATA